MKKLYLPLFLFLCALLMPLTSTAKAKVINRPQYGLQNTWIMEIDKIELSDSETLIYSDMYSDPGSSVGVYKDAYLLADGKRYEITGIDGAQLDTLVQVPESGQISFVLRFPAIPKGTKTMDFIERDEGNCFKIWDIDLTGKAKRYTPQLPIDLLGRPIDKNYQLPDPVMAIGRTRLKVHLSGLKEGFELPDASFIIGNLFTMSNEEVETEKISGSEYIFTFDQYTTATGILDLGKDMVMVALYPGEEAEVFYDFTARIKKSSRYNPDPEITYALFRGKYAELNNLMVEYNDSVMFMPLDSESLAMDTTILQLSMKEYIDKMFTDYKNGTGKILNNDIPDCIKTIMIGNFKSALVLSMNSMGYVYDKAYRKKHNLSNEDPVDLPSIQLNLDDLGMFKQIAPNDSLWMYSFAYFFTLPQLVKFSPSEIIINLLTGSTEGIMQDLFKCLPVMSIAGIDHIMPMGALNRLFSTSSPFYGEAFMYMDAKYKNRSGEPSQKKEFRVFNSPYMDDGDFLEKLTLPFKGKVTVVIFWTIHPNALSNYNVLHEIMPQLEEHDIDIVYIATDNSPGEIWATMLPKIGGNHYYIPRIMWDKIYIDHKFTGIPAFMIFDRDGKISYSRTGFPGNDAIIKELEKIW